MFENMVDVLIYLYENYMDGGERAPIDPHVLEDELSEAGFNSDEIEQALRWLDELADEVEAPQYVPQDLGYAADSLRVYAERECAKLSAEARGFLLALEQNGILDPLGRELVIDRLLATHLSQVTADEVKWVVLLVLLNRPGQEDAFSQMEEMVYDGGQAYLH
ncbi:hypothetical protein MARPU_04220 [Marichromatium purpuratum 984]|uniref:Protein Smg homolog n=1 Tax=Marichromatium purpuratum 984 TaxID=765910 RepID=W0E286_MARPU|nr:DUF494 domain-containing protein [Marichromatium purpuratum]AHF03176.1 hypothetical protein MARPU_04220 [Marichromatium purpuratum 984]